MVPLRSQGYVDRFWRIALGCGFLLPCIFSDLMPLFAVRSKSVVLANNKENLNQPCAVLCI